jgi:hypothetical protein
MESSNNDPNPDQTRAHSITRLIAQEESRKVILQHLDLCPFANLQIESRVRNLEISYARLIGFMAGSGLLGGATGAMITRLLPAT